MKYRMSIVSKKFTDLDKNQESVFKINNFELLTKHSLNKSPL